MIDVKHAAEVHAPLNITWGLMQMNLTVDGLGLHAWGVLLYV